MMPNHKGGIHVQMYGYGRVSTKEQHADRQMVALLKAGVCGENILIDKQSGKDFNRPKYRQLIKKLKPGDTLIIKSIDRLGRNYEEIMEQWRIITKELQVFVAVLDMPLLDTRQKERDLTGVFIADLVLQILSYVAQTEREFIRQRQREGIAAAVQRGVRFGRPLLAPPKEFAGVYEAWRGGRLSVAACARQLRVARSTFTRWCSQAY